MASAGRRLACIVDMHLRILERTAFFPQDITDGMVWTREGRDVPAGPREPISQEGPDLLFSLYMVPKPKHGLPLSKLESRA